MKKCDGGSGGMYKVAADNISSFLISAESAWVLILKIQLT